MAQQTALQFFLMGLVELEIGKGIPTDKQVELHKLFEQAKAMEKEQIIIARWIGDYSCDSIKAEQYYNETYGNTNSN
jgi:hypothetical protein